MPLVSSKSVLFVPERENEYFNKTPLRRLMKKAGAKAVAGDALQEMIRQLEKKARNVTQLAVKIAEHAGRKTVTADDITLALEYLEKQGADNKGQ